MHFTSNMPMTPIVETERLILRNLTFDDAPFILHLVNTPSWIQYIGDRGVRNLEDARNYLKNGPLKSYELNGFGLYLIVLKTAGTPIGMCGLIKRPSLKDVDIGFALLPEYTGKGLAFEAASATMEFAKNNLQLSRIVAITDPENERSQKLLLKIGLQFEKVIPAAAESEELFLFGADFQ